MWRSLRRAWIPVVLRAWPLARLWYRIWGLTLDGHPDDTVWYFAYGANMHDSSFRERRGMRPVESRAGRVTGYRLRFNLEGRPRDGRHQPTSPLTMMPKSGAFFTASADVSLSA